MIISSNVNERCSATSWEPHNQATVEAARDTGWEGHTCNDWSLMLMIKIVVMIKIKIMTKIMIMTQGQRDIPAIIAGNLQTITELVIFIGNVSSALGLIIQGRYVEICIFHKIWVLSLLLCLKRMPSFLFFYSPTGCWGFVPWSGVAHLDLEKYLRPVSNVFYLI